MIIAHIIGGLGNQMFQYAAGRALSLAHNAPLLLDVQDFKGYGLHNGFELFRLFDIQASIANNWDVFQVLGLRALSPLRRKLFHQRFSKFRGAHLFVDSLFSQMPQLIDMPSSSYLMGNWQSEYFFRDIADTIRTDFTFKLPMSKRNAELAGTIASINAISLHVRRGDIASNPTSLAVHGLCSLDYYRQAIELMTSKLPDPEFVIFSDDINWARKNLKIRFPCHYVDENKGPESYNDMRLMSFCKHHIVANSSFSWWGAWLSTGEKKIVIAPKKWFTINYDSLRIIPSSWIRI